MEQTVPSSELNLENVGKDDTLQPFVVEETAGCHCSPKEEELPEQEIIEKPEEVKEDCEPAPPLCRDPPEEEPPKEETTECPPCPPCPPCPGPEPEEKCEEPAEEPAEDVEKLAEPLSVEEEPEKFPRAPCPEPLYPPCKTPPAPCQTIVCPQDD